VPSKKSLKAMAEAKAYTIARWRYLVRNAAFRKELRALGEGGIESRERGLAELGARWGFDSIPRRIPERLAWIKGPGNEIRFLESQTARVQSTPVTVTRLDPDKRVAVLKVRLEHPRHFLLALVEAELGKLWRLNGRVAQSRRRLDKTDLYLRVQVHWDRGHPWISCLR
jgi:hypothetical protein